MSAEEEPLELSSNEDDLDLSSDTERYSEDETNGRQTRFKQSVNPRLLLKQQQDPEVVVIDIIEEITMEEMEPKRNPVPEPAPEPEPTPEPELGPILLPEHRAIGTVEWSISKPAA